MSENIRSVVFYSDEYVEQPLIKDWQHWYYRMKS